MRRMSITLEMKCDLAVLCLAFYRVDCGSFLQKKRDMVTIASLVSLYSIVLKVITLAVHLSFRFEFTI